MGYRIGVDVGGTFTDVAAIDGDGTLRTAKVLSTPDDLSVGVAEGLSRLELWLDQTSLLLAAMRMTFPNGDTKLMVLEDVVANAPLDPGVFTIVPPPVPASRP